jgi:hypothetical protein
MNCFDPVVPLLVAFSATQVLVSFFEIAGKKCFDLLHPKRTEIFLKDSEEGDFVHLQGAEEPIVHNADMMLALVAEGKGRRATHSTDINAASSRSHAVLRISVYHPEGDQEGHPSGGLTSTTGKQNENDTSIRFRVF